MSYDYIHDEIIYTMSTLYTMSILIIDHVRIHMSGLWTIAKK